jgi:hypothetical protein
MTMPILEKLIGSVMGAKGSSPKNILPLNKFKKLYSFILQAKAFAAEAAAREQEEDSDDEVMIDEESDREQDENFDDDVGDETSHEKMVRKYFERLKDRRSDNSVLVDKLIASPEVQEALSDGDITMEQIEEVIHRRMKFSREEWSPTRKHNPDARMIFPQFEFFLFSIREFFPPDGNTELQGGNGQTNNATQPVKVDQGNSTEIWEETMDFAFLFEELIGGKPVDLSYASATKEKIDIILAKRLPMEKIVFWGELKFLLEVEAMTANHISTSLERVCDILIPPKVLKTVILANSTNIEMSPADQAAIQSILAQSISFDQFKELIIILDSFVDKKKAEKASKTRHKESKSDKKSIREPKDGPAIQQGPPKRKTEVDNNGKKPDSKQQHENVAKGEKKIKEKTSQHEYQKQAVEKFDKLTDKDDVDEDVDDFDDMDDDEELNENYQALNTVNNILFLRRYH